MWKTAPGCFLRPSTCIEDRDRFKPYEKHHSTARRRGPEQPETGTAENIVLWLIEDTDLEHRGERYTAEAAELFHGGIFVPRDGGDHPLSSNFIFSTFRIGMRWRRFSYEIMERTRSQNRLRLCTIIIYIEVIVLTLLLVSLFF